MTFEEIHTERLILRSLTQDVYDHVFSDYSEDALQDFFGGHEALEKNRSRYEKGLTTFNRSFHNFQLLLKDSGELIGTCGFHTWYTEHSRAEIGYDITNPGHWGKGYMSEAVREIIRYGFERLSLNRIEALVAPGNNASLSILQKFGFVKEGYLRSHYFKNGNMEDSVMYGLLKEDFEQQKRGEGQK